MPKIRASEGAHPLKKNGVERRLLFMVFPVIAEAIIRCFGAGPNGPGRVQENGSCYSRAGVSGVTLYPLYLLFVFQSHALVVPYSAK